MPSSKSGHRFAHLSDVHVGAWREAKLARLSMETFQWMLDRCLEEKVDFVVISGDLFDSNIPDLQAVKEAAEAMRKVRERGVSIYVTYGSHDYSVSATSIVDVLDGAGLFTNVVRLGKAAGEGERIRLGFVEDPATGAKLAGLYGRRNGLESEYYRLLDRGPLEREKGFKVFLFHSAIEELRPPGYEFGQSVPISLFPKGFDYYAGGHVHARILEEIPGYGRIAFPGPLFGHGFGDLEEIAKGTKRGFFIVDFGEEVEDVRFVEVPLPKVAFETIDADGKTAAQLTKSLEKLAGSLDCDGTIVLVKVTGRLSSGKTAEVPFDKVRKEMEGKKAIIVRINRAGLTSAETSSAKVSGKTREEIEEYVLGQAVKGYSVEPSLEPGLRAELAGRLSGEAGVRAAKKLLGSLAQEAKENERKEVFRDRMVREAKEALGLEGS
ncbi:MAG TPA: DNA repair exonuclease [Conexivisphaerales archaeon]|nr:DNA repair exonuclease [Conexivisphaerales archaeon]